MNDDEKIMQLIKTTEPKLIKSSNLSDVELKSLVDESILYVDGFDDMPSDIKDVAVKLYACHLIEFGTSDDIQNMKVGQITLQRDTNSKADDPYLARFNDIISQYSMNGEVLFNAGGEFIDRPTDLRLYPYPTYGDWQN